MDVVLAALVSAVVGGVSGWVAALLRYRRERHARSGDDAATSLREAFERLATLRSLYQGAAGARWRGGPAAGEMASAENRFTSTCDASADESVAAAARAYVEVGRLYASGDQDTGSSHEEHAHDEVSAVMRRRVRALQSP